MKASPPADGKTVSHEAIYRFIYALPKGDLAKHGGDAALRADPPSTTTPGR